MSLAYERWPCSKFPGPSIEGYGMCPGDGYQHSRCTACHGLYTGYVALCPMHKAAPELLKALWELYGAVARAMGNDPTHHVVADSTAEAGIAAFQLLHRLGPDVLALELQS